MTTVYEAMGGHDAVLRLAHAWHERVLADEVVAHAFSHGYRSDHTERLAAYWAEALGGPTTYSEQYGDESTVVRTHSGNGPHEEMDRRAIACFDQALTDAGIVDPRLHQTLYDYFRLGDHDVDVPLPRLEGRRPRQPDHPPLVLGRPAILKSPTRHIRGRFCGVSQRM